MAGLFDENEVCGAVMSIRYAEDIISIWNKSSTDEAGKQRLCDQLKTILSLPPTFQMDYKAHDTAMKDSNNYKIASHDKPRS